MVYRGQVKNGRIEIDGGTRLPEGINVIITLKADVKESQDDGSVPTLFEQLADVIGTVPDLPEDLSVNHDHYLYGTARRE